MVRAGVLLLLWSTRARLPPGIFTFRTKIATEGTFTNNQLIHQKIQKSISLVLPYLSVEYSLHKTMSSSSSSSSSEDDDEDLFYAPSYNRKREEEKKNNALGTTSKNNGTNKRKVEEEEEEERKRTRALISDSDSDDDDDVNEDDVSDDEKDDEEEEEEEKEEEKPTSINALVSESSDSDAPPSTLARRDRAHYNDEKMREASALMRELTKKTDARVFEDENDGDEQRNGVTASVDDVGACGAEDDEDEDDLRYEPIQLVFAFSNTNKVEFETSKRYTFERIWKDFVDEHHPEGDVAKAKFTFDGDRIKVSEDTPETLDMDDEDVVDVLL